LRSEIERIAATGKSLMPEGLEQQIPPPAMADLLAYIRRRLPPPKSFHGNTPRVVALEDGRYSLFGRYAELRGPTIRYQIPEFVVAYWQSPEDWAAWEIEVAQAGRYRVELEYGCPENSAGNRFELKVDAARLQGQVAPTGAWETFKRVPVGDVELASGRRRVELRPQGSTLKEALLDLRAIYLTPIGAP
jgi:hypothetical protein